MSTGDAFAGSPFDTVAAVDPARVTEFRAYLDRLLELPGFVSSRRRSQLLRYLVERLLAGEGDRITEYGIGLDVFNKPATFDPRIEATVRAEMSRLRRIVAEHYQYVGAGDPWRIHLPSRGYVPSIEPRPVTAVPLRAQPNDINGPMALYADPRRNRARWAATAAVLAIVCTAVAWFLLDQRHTIARYPNAEAEKLYLQGLYHWQKRTPESLTQAVDSFTQSIVHDPRYALAYVGLANSYNLLREFSTMPENEAFPRALAATQKALELDDRSAEAHSSLAFISFWWNWNAALADRAYRRAIVLDPNYVTAHHWYANFLCVRGRQTEALEQINVAHELEPAAISILADKGLILYFAGQRHAALTLLEQLQKEDPDLQSSPRYLALIYLAEQDYPNYLRELKHAARGHEVVSQRIAQAAEQGLARGPKAMFQSVLDAEIDLYRQGLLPAYYVAETCAYAGKTLEAIRYLEMSSQEPISLFLSYRVDPAFRGIRSDPLFQKLDARFEPLIATGTFPARH